MSDEMKTVKKPQDPDNPYNIDFEKERRLKRQFQVWIAVGFVFAAIMLAAGYFMDFAISQRRGEPPAVTPYSSPGDARGVVRTEPATRGPEVGR